ncbi:hypothetical protein [Gaetbulibacter aestuarii]|uniref:PKD domain-containing protein n=1 Tax=Gaetbulibacter aestuarii TaxID=1502358 RepID=A0ABW7MZA2_9FLAO
MKTLKYLISFVLVLLVSCDQDNHDLSFVESHRAPSDISLAFQITQDNSGLVSITPNGQGAVTYNIDLGDGTTDKASVKQGESFEHVYAEGTYSLTVEAIGLTGLKNVITQDLVVSFKAPENLAIDAQIDPTNPFRVLVSATADFAAAFEVYFDTSNPDEVATPLQLDGTVGFEYSAVGDYTLKVVALSGGAESTEGTTTVTVNVPVEMPVDFEIFDASKFIGFGGASAEVVPNPDMNGNNSATVGKTVKNGPEVWAGDVIILSSPIDFSNKKVINLDVWSPRPGGKLLFKLENLNDAGIFVEKEVTLQGNSAWENVSIDFTGLLDPNQTYQKLVWFFDFGTVGTGGPDWTFYVDNIKQDYAGVPISQMVQDFEGPAPTFIDFGGAGTQVIANPDASGINTSANVAALTKGNGAEVWAGSFFETGTPIDLSTFSSINVKTWSPKVGITVKLKLENVDASVTYEVDQTTTVANAWENLLFDFSSAPAADYVRVVMFFDFGTGGDGTTYYYDDVELKGTGQLQPLGFQDFEGAAPAFTGFGGASSQVISNPDMSGVNTSANVAELVKGNGSEVWAGTFFEVGTPLDLTSYTSISLKTWSPKSGITVKLKLENIDASVTHEVDMTTTVANSWETLTYDFSAAPAADYVRVVIFFDFGTAGDGSSYYYDDFTLTN